MISKVEITKIAKKQLDKSPPQAKAKLLAWAISLEEIGLDATRKQKGYHDEPLKGQRLGQRSIRLNIQWRAIYIVSSDGKINFIEIKEITPHEYKK
jgi:proteic killer suppression protein